MYVYLTEEQIELLIRLVFEDRIQYDGVTKPYELDMVEQHNRLNEKLKTAKKTRYGE
jgi:hypothetical protein